jgi:hypothetical protein
MHDLDTLTLRGDSGEETPRMTRAQVRSLIDQMARLGYEDKHRAEDLP